MTPADFPLISAGLADNTRVSKNFSIALQAITEGLADGEIANAKYVQIVKPGIANALEYAWESAVQKRFTYAGKFRDLSEPEQQLSWDLNRPQAHTITGTLKKIAKTKLDTEFTRTMVALLNEMGPLGIAVVKLKDMVVKRQPKPDENEIAKAKYLAPMADDSAIAQVQKVLTEITDQSYEKLVSAMVAGIKKKLDRYFVDVEKTKALGPYPSGRQRDLTVYGIYADNKAVQIAIRDFLTTSDGPYDRYAPNVLVKDADRKIEAACRKNADLIRETFIIKNLKKFDSIVSAKGNLKEVKEVGREVDLYGLTGTLKVTFDDGSLFYAKNSVVYSISTLGKPFLRFPLTFHDVKMADGSKMAKPSEERMNTVFVGKSA